MDEEYNSVTASKRDENCTAVRKYQDVMIKLLYGFQETTTEDNIYTGLQSSTVHVINFLSTANDSDFPLFPKSDDAVSD